MTSGASSAGERSDGRVEARDILGRLADEPSVDGDVADATVVDTHTERARRRSERILTASDGDSGRSSLLPETYRKLTSERVAYADRYDAAPEDLETMPVPYVEMGRPVETCSKCDGEGRTHCARCGGDKEAKCRTCHGDGKKTCSACDGDPDSECNACDENGKQECSTCGGSASEECSECGGTGGHSETQQCTRCEGDGWINCRDCGGEGGECSTCGGEATEDCPRCDGDGIEETWIDCSKCGGRKSLGCSGCDGTGKEQCSKCGGTKTITCYRCDGSGEEPCDNCDESGVVRCTDCDEQGTVTCSRCDGGGEVVHAVSGELVFSVDTTEVFDVERVPIDLIESHDGTVVDRQREDPETEDGVYRRVIEEEEIPATTIAYRHAGSEYEAAVIDGELRYDDAPQPTENIRAQIEAAIADGTFEYDSGRSFGGTMRAAPRALLGDAARIAGGVVVASVVLIALGLATTVLPIGDGVEDAIGVGGTAVAALWYARWTGADEDAISTASNGGGLLGPALIGVAAVAAIVQGVVGPAMGLLALALAAALWSRRVAVRLAFEGARIASKPESRKMFFKYEFDGRPSEIEARGLGHMLPDPNPAPSGDLFHRISGVVVVVGLGANLWLASLLALGAVGDGNLLLDYVRFETALVVPAATALLATASLSSIPLGRFLDNDSGGDVDSSSVSEGVRSTGTNVSDESMGLDEPANGSMESDEPARVNGSGRPNGSAQSGGSSDPAEQLSDFQLALLHSVDQGEGNTEVEIKERMVELHDDQSVEASVSPSLRQLTRNGYLQRTDSGYYPTQSGERAIRESRDRIE